MINKKFNLAKGGWLILLCFGIILLGVTNSQAIPLTVTSISYGGPTANGWYTEYYLNTVEFGTIDAFCIENAYADSSVEYELIDLPESSQDSLIEAAKIASLYFGGSVLALTDISSSEAKAATQIAIWKTLGMIVSYSGDLADEVASILNLDLPNSIMESIYIAHSPPGSTNPTVSQDYLVSVPDADIMWLLGPAFIMLGFLGRKKSKDYL